MAIGSSLSEGAPISKFEWEEMKGSDGFEERVNWKDVEKENPPQKGFGEIGKKKALKKEAEGVIIKGVKADDGSSELGKRVDKRDNPDNQHKIQVRLNSGATINFQQYLETPGVIDTSDIDYIVSELNNPPSGKLFDTRILDGMTDEIINGGLYNIITNQPVRGCFNPERNLIQSTRFEVSSSRRTTYSIRYTTRQIAENQWHEIGHKIWEERIAKNEIYKYQFSDLVIDISKTKDFDEIDDYAKHGTERQLEEFFCNRFRDYYRKINILRKTDVKLATISDRRVSLTLESFFDMTMRE